jgi:hypothetical protein
MAVKKLTISLPEDLAERAREEAAREGLPLSQWMADAVAWKTRNAAAREAIRQFEQECGPLTEEEIEQARAKWQD